MNDKIRKFMEQHNGYVLTCQTEGYEFLDAEEEWICFENPHGSADIMWRISHEDVFFFFGQWFERYSFDDEGIARIMELAKNIMNDQCYLWQIDLNGQRLLSMINDEPGTFFETARDNFRVMIGNQEVDILPAHAKSRFVFWDPMFMEQVTKTPYLN